MSTTDNSVGPPVETSTMIGTLAFYNVMVTGVLSVILNGLLLITVTSRLGNSRRAYRKTLTFSTVVSILFSISFVLTCPIVTALGLGTFTAVMICTNGYFVKFSLNHALLIISVTLLTELILLPPITQYFRYCQVCRGDLKPKNLGIAAISNIILLSLSCGLCYYCSSPSETDYQNLSFITVRFAQHYTPFLLISYSKQDESVVDTYVTIAAIICVFTYFFILAISLFVMIFCSIKVNNKMTESKNASANLIKLQKKMKQLLFSQFFCTIVLVQIPFYYSIIGPIFGVTRGVVTDTMPFLFAWTPVINAATTFILNSDIRKALIRKQVDSMGWEAKRSTP